MRNNSNKCVVGITGSNGVLGKILQKKLKENNIKYSNFLADIVEKKQVDIWIKDNNFKYIFHFAALVPTNLVNNNFDKAKTTNIIGTQNLVSSIKKNKEPPMVFYASSSHVYASKNTPISEIDTIKPISKYGETKLGGEYEIQELKYYCIGRIFSFFHKTQTGNFLYPNIKNRLQKEDLTKFELYGANSIRDISNAEAIVDKIYFLFKKNSTGVYNIGSGNGISIADFVQSLTDKKITLIKKGNSDYLVANISKLNKVLNNE